MILIFLLDVFSQYLVIHSLNLLSDGRIHAFLVIDSLIEHLSHTLTASVILNKFIIFDHEFVKILKFTQSALSLAIVPDEFVLVKVGIGYDALWMSV